MKALRISKREQTILVAACAAVAAALLVRFILQPLASHQARVAKRIRLVNAQVLRYRDLIDRRDQIKRSYEQLAGPSAKAAPEGPLSLMDALVTIEDMAKVAGLQIISIRPYQQEQESGDYREILIDVQAQASFESYVRFFYALEKSLNPLKMKTLQLYTVSGKDGGLEARMAISFLVLR